MRVKILGTAIVVAATLAIGSAHAAMPKVCNDIMDKVQDDSLPMPKYTDEDIKGCIAYLDEVEVDFSLKENGQLLTNGDKIAQRIMQLAEVKALFYRHLSFVQN